MTAAEIVSQLKAIGSPSVQRLFEQHGVKDINYGVKIGDLKTIQKKVKKNHKLALELYETGVSDARYLAGLIADEKAVTKAELQHWLNTTESSSIIEYTIPWLAAESASGWELGKAWIESADEKAQTAGWATLANVVSLVADIDLNLTTVKKLLQKVESNITNAPNRVRYVMNGFLIGVGCYVEPLSNEAAEIGKRLGKISVDMNGTACKVPYAPDYISKMAAKGTVGKKKKRARC